MTEQEYTEYLSDIDHTDWRMDWTIASEAWDNDELEDALADIASLVD